MRAALSFLAVVLLMTGCRTTASGTADEGGSNRVTSEELRAAASEGLNLLQLVQRLRPQWLTASRGATSLSAGGRSGVAYARVVLNGVPQGGPENPFDDLRGIDVTAVDGIEYLSAADATTRFGTGYPRGAILVRLR